MKKKMQERKKKNKEKATKGKLLRRREAIRKKRKYEAGLEKDVAASAEKLMPIINPHKEKLRKEKALAHNMEILKKLEEEYKKSQERRAMLNADLEADGYLTLQDKVRAMGEKATIAAGGMSLIEKTKQTLEALNPMEDNNSLNLNIAPEINPEINENNL